jgi:hypothetical protein
MTICAHSQSRSPVSWQFATAGNPSKPPSRICLSESHIHLSHVQACLQQPIRGYPINPLRNPIYFVQDLLTRGSVVERARSQQSEWFLDECTGYNKQQRTRPHTLGYALADSPAGLLAWIYEKLTEWTDAYPWTDDEGMSCGYLRVPSTNGWRAQCSIGSQCTGSRDPVPRRLCTFTTTTSTLLPRTSTRTCVCRSGCRCSHGRSSSRRSRACPRPSHYAYTGC